MKEGYEKSFIRTRRVALVSLCACNSCLHRFGEQEWCRRDGIPWSPSASIPDQQRSRRRTSLGIRIGASFRYPSLFPPAPPGTPTHHHFFPPRTTPVQHTCHHLLPLNSRRRFPTMCRRYSRRSMMSVTRKRESHHHCSGVQVLHGWNGLQAQKFSLLYGALRHTSCASCSSAFISSCTAAGV